MLDHKLVAIFFVDFNQKVLFQIMICIVGDPGAMEMSWNEVPGEKLFEPVVTMVINFPSFVFLRNDNHCLTFCRLRFKNARNLEFG